MIFPFVYFIPFFIFFIFFSFISTLYLCAAYLLYKGGQVLVRPSQVDIVRQGKTDFTGEAG
jgi:hypothetical protein